MGAVGPGPVPPVATSEYWKARYQAGQTGWQRRSVHEVPVCMWCTVCVFFRVPLQVTDVVELHAKKGRNLHLSYLDLLCKAAARVGTLVDLSA